MLRFFKISYATGKAVRCPLPAAGLTAQISIRISIPVYTLSKTLYLFQYSGNSLFIYF